MTKPNGKKAVVSLQFDGKRSVGDGVGLALAMGYGWSCEGERTGARIQTPHPPANAPAKSKISLPFPAHNKKSNPPDMALTHFKPF